MRNSIFFTAVFVFLIAYLVSCGGDTGNSNTANRGTNTGTPAATNTTNSGNANAAYVNRQASNTNNAVVVSKDNSFLITAGQDGMAEIELGKLAASKAQNAEVKQFGQKMVTDHTKAGTELKELAAKKSVALPNDVNSSQKSDMEKLEGLSGADFDKEYVKIMVDAHENAVKLFQTQADSGEDSDIKAFASKTLPTLKMHLEMIKKMNDKMK